MKLDLFLAGMLNKETWASAWLATLLRDEPGFRRAFFARVDVDPPLDPDEDWKVDVEASLGALGTCDVVLRSQTTCVFVENKVSRSAVTSGQFGGYYQGVIEDVALARLDRIVGIYLAPDRRSGVAPLREVTMSGLLMARRAEGHRDDAVCLGWKEDLPPVIDAVDADDWFAQEGLGAILDHIRKLETGRPPDEQREQLRQLMVRVSRRVREMGEQTGDWGPDAALARWASRGEEAFQTENQVITTLLALSYRESDDARAELIDVFVDGEIHVRARVSFNPSTKIGQRNADLMGRWNALVRQGVVEVPGIGGVPARNETTFELAQEFRGSSEQLEELLVLWASSVLRFVAGFVASPPAAPPR